MSRNAAIFLPQNPYPPQSGIDRRSLEMMRGLHEMGYTVTALGGEHITQRPWTPEVAASLQDYGVSQVRVYQRSYLDWKVINLLKRYYKATKRQPLPYKSAFHTPPSMRRWFSHTLEDISPDLIFMFYALWDNALDHRRFKRTLRVVDNIDLVTLNQKMWRAVEELLPPPPVDPQAVGSRLVEESFFKDLNFAPAPEEYRIYDRYHYTLAISKREADIIRRMTQRTKTVYVPMMQEVCHLPNDYGGPALFTTGPNPFNMQGYLYFVRKVLPLVRDQAPDFCLQVTGYCSERVKPQAGVLLSGFVPDLKAVYASARLLVCPVFGGTGQQVKIVEAMAHGVPVVALRAAAEQSPLLHGINGLIADTAEEFAEHILTLWYDVDLCRRMGQAARESIEEGFSRSHLREALSQLVL